MTDVTHTRNPDMVAFTIGRITLSLMANGGAVSLDEIWERLLYITSHGPIGGVSPEMAEGAISEISSLREAAA